MKDEFQNLPEETQKAVLQVVRTMDQPLIKKPSLQTVSMTELFDMSFEPRTPVIEGLLQCGTYILAGSPKIGKSFFMNQLGYHIATGTPLWDYKVRKGAVLYLALEDEYSRLQSRLNQMFGVESVDGLHIAVQSKTLNEGLVEQLEEFVHLHPDTRLIIVDTLQKVREVGNESYSYAADYQTITALKGFTDKHNLTILVVHHTRKMEAADSFDMISGTNGLLGAADGAVILQKKKRTDNEATMQIVGRDQPDQELKLEFNREKCLWELIKAETQLFERPVDPLVVKVADFMSGKELWTGTASELLALMGQSDTLPHVLTRKLNVSVSVLFNRFGIKYWPNQRTNSQRGLTLERLLNEETTDTDDGDSSDAMTLCDANSDTTPAI